MNADLGKLQEMVGALQTELGAVKQRLARLEAVVRVTENAGGGMEATIECSRLRVWQQPDRAHTGIELGADEAGAFQRIYHRAAEGQTVAVQLAFENGEPRLELRGRDERARVEACVEKDRGAVVVFGPDGSPGAIMRGLPGGGSVAVLQRDGRPRGVLMHTEPSAKGLESYGVPTELVFANADGQTMLKLRADNQGALVSMGPPGQSDAAALVARENGPALLLHSPGATNSVSILAGEMAEVCVHRGKFAGGGPQACLSVGDFGSSLALCKHDGEKTVEIAAFELAGTVTLNDAHSRPCVVLSHHFGSHSSLSLQSVTDQEGIRALASAEVSSIEVKATNDGDTKIVSAVHGDKPVSFVQKNSRALVMMGEGEQGGIICAYGPDAGHSGIATLSGGPVAGALVLATTDGTAQLTLDATDHGGRVMINNDLGFQRIAMGVYQEAAGIHLNHTGQLGVQAVATPKGGVVTVRDAQGHVLASLPETEAEPGSRGWGISPRDY